MGLPRITTRQITFNGTTPVSFNWLCPAGVTLIIFTVFNTSIIADLSGVPIEVVPGTTYTITVNSKNQSAVGANNSFDNLLLFTNGQSASISWVE